MWGTLLTRLSTLTGLLGGNGNNNDEEVVEKTFVDPLVNAVNRLVRPAVLFGIIAMFIWAVVDPAGFAASAVALSKLPENAWLLILIVFGSWFLGKGVNDMRRPPRPPRGPNIIVDVDNNIDTSATASTTTKDDAFEDVLDSMASHNDALTEWRNAAGRDSK